MRVVIVANGMMAEPREEFTRWMITADGDLDNDCVVVGANGGTKHLLACGHTPQHIIGDMDSITSETRAKLKIQGVSFHTHPRQKDETDLELALIWAAQRHPDAEIVVLGAMGGRPDQALANLLLLGLPQLSGRKVTAAEGNWRVCVVHGGEKRTFSGFSGDTLSLIPLGGDAEGVRTSGLQYPLKEETLRFGPARGVSNVFLGKEASVFVGSGILWVFQEKKK